MPSSRPLAVIAGVGAGTGSAIARCFARNGGYSIVVLARNPNNYSGVVQEINAAGGNAAGFSADVTDSESVKNAFGQIKQKYGEESLAAGIYNVGGVRFRFRYISSRIRTDKSTS